MLVQGRQAPLKPTENPVWQTVHVELLEQVRQLAGHAPEHWPLLKKNPVAHEVHWVVLLGLQVRQLVPVQVVQVLLAWRTELA